MLLSQIVRKTDLQLAKDRSFGPGAFADDFDSPAQKHESGVKQKLPQAPRNLGSQPPVTNFAFPSFVRSGSPDGLWFGAAGARADCKRDDLSQSKPDARRPQFPDNPGSDYRTFLQSLTSAQAYVGVGPAVMVMGLGVNSGGNCAQVRHTGVGRVSCNVCL